MMHKPHWQSRFMDVAHLVAQWALPSWREGCVVVDPQKRILSLGYTGFPRGAGVEDILGSTGDAPSDAVNEERQRRLLVRAHENAILFAASSLEGAAAYLSYSLDITSASTLVQAGISHIVCPAGVEEFHRSSAMEEARGTLEAREILRQTGVTLELLPERRFRSAPETRPYLEAASTSCGKGKWDNRYLAMAVLISSWSKDPSTKVGCVLADEANRFVSAGFNGFAKGVDDCEKLYQDRSKKYLRVIHAEKNAVLHAQRHRVAGATAYVTMQPCAPCAAFLANAGVSRVVSMNVPTEFRERWKQDLELSAWVLGDRFRPVQTSC